MAAMKNIRSIFTVLFLSLLLASCFALQPAQYPERTPEVRCLPSFPDRDGWYGGDGAYSIALNEWRTLWIFGDTFVSDEEGRKDRIGMDVVMGTTLAVSTCAANTGFNIRYYLQKKKGQFVSSFGESEWLWPQDPFIAKGVLYLPLLVIQALPDAPPPFNFTIAGHKIARIKDFQADDPRLWPVDYLDWTGALAKGVQALATTSVVHQDHVYFYPLYRYRQDNINISGNILARIAIDHLDNPVNHFEYWTADGWQKKLQPEKVKIIFAAGASELSVRYHAQGKEWMAVYLSPENRGNQLLYSTAHSPAGPWSPPATFNETIAEIDPQSPLYDQNTFCYAGKEHHQFASGKNLVITYVCNSLEDSGRKESFIRKNLFLYRPTVKVIRR